MRVVALMLLIVSCNPKHQLGDQVTFQGTYGKCTGKVKAISDWPYWYTLSAKCSGVKFPVNTTIPETYLKG